MFGGFAVSRPSAITVSLDTADPEPRRSDPSPITVDRVQHVRSYRRQFQPVGTLPGSFYMELAQAKRERKAEKLRAISRHWPQQLGFRP
ncbi:hypothetical protein I2750_19590 [Bacillus sp. PR5]|nr:hypothetical protein [Bacillus sp. PR5]